MADVLAGHVQSRPVVVAIVLKFLPLGSWVGQIADLRLRGSKPPWVVSTLIGSPFLLLSAPRLGETEKVFYNNLLLQKRNKNYLCQQLLMVIPVFSTTLKRLFFPFLFFCHLASFLLA